MDAHRVLELWNASEPAWQSSTNSANEPIKRVAAGFHLAKRNRRGTITSDDTEHHVPLLEDDLEQSASNRSVAMSGLPMLPPHSRVVLIQLLTIGILDATYTAFKVPISFALPFDLSPTSLRCIVDELAGLLFTIDMIMHFHTGIVYVEQSTAKLIMDGRAVASYYIWKGSFFIDFLATIPSWVEAVILICFPMDDKRRQVVTAVTVLRLLRLLRLSRFVQSVLLMSMGGRLGRRLMGKIPVTFVYLANIMYGMAVLANLLGCLWLFTARCEGLHNSWLTNVGGYDLSDSSGAAQYVAAVHFAMTTMATVGYGDTHPTTTLERIIAMLIMTIGIFFFGFLVSALSELVQAASKSARRASLLHNKIKDVEGWMRERQLPADMRRDVTAYYADIWVSNAEAHEAELLEELPGHMRGRIVGHLLDDVLSASELFSRLQGPARSMLAAALRPRAMLPGHDLCRAGDFADCMWILQSGVVAAVQHSQNVDVLYAPAILGEAALFQEDVPEASRRAVTFRAQGSCMLWELHIADIQALVYADPQLKQAMQEGYRSHMAASTHEGSRGNWREALRTVKEQSSAQGVPGRSESTSQHQAAAHRNGSDISPSARRLAGPWRGLERVSHSSDLMYHSPAARAKAGALQDNAAD